MSTCYNRNIIQENIMKNPYADIDFDAVATIDDLSDIFRHAPFDPVKHPRTGTENPVGILEQYRLAGRDNYENAAMVIYLDRTAMFSEKKIELKSMWFDEDGNRTVRPVRNTDGN
jgi:hypothetical protein